MIDIQELTARKTGKSYPCVFIKLSNNNEALPVVIRTLEKGDMQLILEFNGITKVIDRISPSAININNLLRVNGSLIYRKSETEDILIENIDTYLSCI